MYLLPPRHRLFVTTAASLTTSHSDSCMCRFGTHPSGPSKVVLEDGKEQLLQDYLLVRPSSLLGKHCTFDEQLPGSNTIAVDMALFTARPYKSVHSLPSFLCRTILLLSAPLPTTHRRLCLICSKCSQSLRPSQSSRTPTRSSRSACTQRALTCTRMTTTSRRWRARSRPSRPCAASGAFL